MIMTDGGHFFEGGWSMVMLRDHADGCDFARKAPRRNSPLAAIDRSNLSASPGAHQGRHFDRIRFNASGPRRTDAADDYDFSLAALLRAASSGGEIARDAATCANTMSPDAPERPATSASNAGTAAWPRSGSRSLLAVGETGFTFPGRLSCAASPVCCSGLGVAVAAVFTVHLIGALVIAERGVARGGAPARRTARDDPGRTRQGHGGAAVEDAVRDARCDAASELVSDPAIVAASVYDDAGARGRGRGVRRRARADRRRARRRSSTRTATSAPMQAGWKSRSRARR